MRPPRRRLLALLCVGVAVTLAIDAGWIHAKAVLAQALLERSWQRTIADGVEHRPWSWADTRPVARLTVPRLKRSQIVLAGDNGRTLAFGPGWAEASARPGADGVAIISGHRDTHFAWLRELADGDVISIEDGEHRIDYVVDDTRVVDSSRERVVLEQDRNELRLVTCWPFDAVVAGGPLRYVVTAQRTPASDSLPAASRNR